MQDSQGKVVILGAGVSGLTAGWVLAKKGYSVEIIEREGYAGGLAVTKSDREYRWDLGPHNLHSIHQHVIAFIKKRFADLFEHSITSRILKRGKFIHYPLHGIKVITSLPPLRLIQAGISFTRARISMFLRDPAKDDTFQDWITNRFGRVLFHEYFFDYPRKVWGLEPSQIDRYVAEKRIPIIGLTDLVRTFFCSARNRNQSTPSSRPRTIICQTELETSQHTWKRTFEEAEV